MKKYPAWKFYMDVHTDLPWRTNGVDHDGNLLGVTLKDKYPMFDKITVANLILVDRWPDHISKKFSANEYACSSFFTDPLGYLLYVDQYDKLRHGMLKDIHMPC
ncbi:MAG: hypothetical protein EOP45_19985 [Sphingobacteriaceae bacterium]|nr:MAG: hypothetical protein EOP45_19985 [Sphingobacteriaceae bacterium]